MTEQTFWYGTVIERKPLRLTPGGEKSAFAISVGVEVEGDKKENQWIRLPSWGNLWITTAVLDNVREVTKTVEPPPTPDTTAARVVRIVVHFDDGSTLELP